MPDLGISTPPDAVCIVRLSAIGDTCHTVPVVRAIQRAWPDTKITWIIGKTEYSLLSGMSGIEFAVLDKRAGFSGYRALHRQLKQRRFPILLHMHASVRAGLASLMARADIRLGFDKARARDYQWLFCNRRIPARAQQHVMDGLFEFATAVGINDHSPVWDLPIGDAAQERAAELVEAGRPTLVISPCTGQRFRNFRNWSQENYSAIADYAANKYDAQILLTGGDSEIERHYADAILATTQCTPIDLVGKTTLKELVAILAAASVVLCPDSGPAHMATAVGTPVVGLYATSNRLRTGPYNSQHLVVDKYPEAVQAEFGTPVEALRWGQRVRNPAAMDLITVDDVIEKLDQAFAERSIEKRHN